MKFVISVGHTASGTNGCGAVDLLDESKCTREVSSLVVDGLDSLGYDVNLIQVDRGNSYNCEDCYYRADKANKVGCDLFVEIHFNKGINRKGDGVEVYTISNSSIAQNAASNICKCISSSLNITNRGVKNQKFIVLSHTTMPAILVECMFVDGKDANKTYNARKIANAIIKGLTGIEPEDYKVELYYVVTDYLPKTYAGYDGVDITSIINTFFNGVKCYVRSDDKGIWIETQYLTKSKCDELKDKLGKYFYAIK